MESCLCLCLCLALFAVFGDLVSCAGARQSDAVLAAPPAGHATDSLRVDGELEEASAVRRDSSNHASNRPATHGRILKFTIPELVEFLKPVMLYFADNYPGGGGIFSNWFGYAPVSGAVTIANNSNNANYSSQPQLRDKVLK
ncbi:uncharacterized protein LOC134535282 [Bacillus rossius redtenbacheri]|uniref:uncharacterized protein LOC134535282 n=1 Tax=Bacillus rossius redtenbacheri TaxID=93214 RepID=UPI002FDF0642